MGLADTLYIDNTICTQELSQKIAEDAAAVKVKYEIINDYYFGKVDELETDLNGDGVIGEIDEYGPALKVIIEGVTENIYVKLENDVDYNVPEQKYHYWTNGYKFVDVLEKNDNSNIDETT